MAGFHRGVGACTEAPATLCSSERRPGIFDPTIMDVHVSMRMRSRIDRIDRI